MADPPGTLLEITSQLADAVRGLAFGPPTSHVYRPLDYARAPFVRYLERYGAGPKEVLFVGMNPGPFGMTQTGVPFGEVKAARDFLGLEAPVGRPAEEHPKRPVLGYACPRSEPSGARVWGWVDKRFGHPEAFFERFFVWNYCPLLFLEASGKNRTPDALPAHERDPLFAACDSALRAVTTALAPRWVIGFGRFAEERARVALAGTEVALGQVLHPSPASPAANRGWASAVEAQLAALGITLPASAPQG